MIHWMRDTILLFCLIYFCIGVVYSLYLTDNLNRFKYYFEHRPFEDLFVSIMFCYFCWPYLMRMMKNDK